MLVLPHASPTLQRMLRKLPRQPEAGAMFCDEQANMGGGAVVAVLLVGDSCLSLLLQGKCNHSASPPRPPRSAHGLYGALDLVLLVLVPVLGRGT